MFVVGLLISGPLRAKILGRLNYGPLLEQTLMLLPRRKCSRSPRLRYRTGKVVCLLFVSTFAGFLDVLVGVRVSAILIRVCEGLIVVVLSWALIDVMLVSVLRCNRVALSVRVLL